MAGKSLSLVGNSIIIWEDPAAMLFIVIVKAVTSLIILESS